MQRKTKFKDMNRGILLSVWVLFVVFFLWRLDEVCLNFLTGTLNYTDPTFYMFKKYNCSDFLMDKSSNGTVSCDNSTKSVNLIKEDFEVYQKWLEEVKK